MRQPLVSQSSIYQQGEERLFHNSAFVLLALSWIASGVGATLPIADTFLAKLVLLIPPIAISLIFLLLSTFEGFAIWSILLGFLVTQTGYQLDVGLVRTSALEIILIVLLLILLWSNRHTNGRLLRIALPGRNFLIMFGVYSIILFLFSLAKGLLLSNALPQFKGFLLYPLMAFVIVAGVRNIQILRLSVITVIGWYSYIATSGMVQFLRGIRNGGLDSVFRASADYASINTYGITMVCMSLLMLGIGISMKNRHLKLLVLACSFWLFVGAVSSVSRTVWLAGGGGLAILLISGRKVKYAVGLALIAIVLFSILPTQVSQRLDQLSDSSTERRAFYLYSGVEAWKASWLIGWGWGAAYWYLPGIGLSPSGEVPWYHNDYVNLGVQTGVIGVALYSLYWLRFLQAGYRWLRRQRHSELSGYVLGSQMALVGLLVSAGFEHVLWKPDIAGLVGWVSGLMLASMVLANKEPAEAVAT